MDNSKLPKDTRIKLSKEQEAKIWRKINNQGGIKKFSNQTRFSASQIYNWKNKESHLPVNFVTKILEPETLEIKSIKGKGRGNPIQNPDLNIEKIDELLTRINLSVKTNKNGSPMYQTDDLGNLERFTQLLNKIGDINLKIYSREDYYQVNYPKFLHKLLVNLDYQENITGLIDEIGEIDDKYFIFRDRKIEISNFEGELYSRSKSARLAIEKKDSDKLQRIILSESEIAKFLLNQNQD